LGGGLDDLKGWLDERLNKLSEQIETLREDVRSLRRDVRRLERRIDDVEDYVAYLEEKMRERTRRRFFEEYEEVVFPTPAPGGIAGSEWDWSGESLD